MSLSPQVWYNKWTYCEDAVLTLTFDPLGDLVTAGQCSPWRSRAKVSPPGKVLVKRDEGLDFVGKITHFLHCLDTEQPCMIDAWGMRRIMELVLVTYHEAG